MNRNHLSMMLVLALAVLAGCGGGAEQSSGPAPEPTADASSAPPSAEASSPSGEAGVEDPVARAVEIAKAVEADPDDAEAILERHGMTVEEFEALMFEISADPELTRSYEAALAE